MGTCLGKETYLQAFITSMDGQFHAPVAISSANANKSTESIR
jgi:hypothetical protein